MNKQQREEMRRQEEEERLNCDAIDVKPRDYDWSHGYPEEWDYWEAVKCDECDKVVLVHGEERHRDIDPDSDCMGYVNAEGPMMNYYYPLPEFKMSLEEAAKKIVDLPLCLVKFEETDEVVLVLTGGGMDLSWEICAAYMELGYWPPVHFRPPGFVPGMGPKMAMRVIKGLRESNKISQNWRNSALADIDRAEKMLIEVVKDRKKREKKPKA